MWYFPRDCRRKQNEYDSQTDKATTAKITATTTQETTAAAAATEA